MNKGWKWGSRGDAFSKVNETKEKFHITANVSTHRNYSDITKFIADSGTTGNFMPSGSKVINIKKSTVLIEVKPPAGKIVKSTETGWLSNKDLPMEARTVHIFPDFKHALVSIGLFCNNGWLAIFDEKEVRIIDKKTRNIIMIMRGVRKPLTKLFMLDINEN